MKSDQYTILRARMIEMIAAHALHVGADVGKDHIDARVLDVMGLVERHKFVPIELEAYAYLDTPLAIGFDKTMSQPYIIALMTDLLGVRSGDRVLEVGTGLGYHAAILSRLAGDGEVYTVEIVEELGLEAQKTLLARGCDNVTVRIGDGSRGWAEKGPFDGISVTAAPELLPAALFHQLKPGGRMVCPAGMAGSQQLLSISRDAGGKLTVRDVLPVSFMALETGS